MFGDLRVAAATFVGVASFGCAVLGPGAAPADTASELRGPVERRCRGVELESCPDIVEGVLLYATRHPVEGKAALTRGVGKNFDRPDRVRLFADSLLILERAPVSYQHRQAVRSAIEVLRHAAWEVELASLAAKSRSAATDCGSPRAPSRGVVATPAAHRDAEPWNGDVVLVAPWSDETPDAMQDFNQLRSGYVDPTGVERASDCQFGGKPARCAPQIPGRMLVEQLYVSPACPYDVFVQRGLIEEPRWVISAAAGKGLELHAARLPIEQGEFLVIGAVGNGDEPIQADARCGVTWVAAAPERDELLRNPYR